MAVKKTENTKSIKVANFASVLMVIFLSAAFIFEMFLYNVKINYVLTGIIVALTLITLFSILRTSVNHYKMTFNVPMVVMLFYTLLMLMSEWRSEHYLIICLALCAVSCLYSHFIRTLAFIIFQNIVIAALILSGNPIGGLETPFPITLINWAICLLTSIILLILTRAGTVSLEKAMKHQNSFSDLLATTENFVAMVDEHNEIVFGSKTLANMGSIEDPSLIQGRPLIDLFPGKSLKVYAGKLLKEKDDYAEDWEFMLNGQKRYLKASSHRLAGGSGGTLISLYDMTHLAERDEIAVMKDSMKIGLFFMDGNYIIQDHYSRYLEEMLEQENLNGKLLTDIIVESVTPSEMEAIKDYFGMILERAYDQEMLDDINPLSELHYLNKEKGIKKVFQFAFATVERGKGEVFILVTLYDITTRVELQQRLAEEEARRKEEMEAVFEVIQVQPDVFNDFMGDMEHEFDAIDHIQKNEGLSAHEMLVKTYQSIHAIKSNAVILGLNIFGNKVHNLESKIKKLREAEDVPFNDILDLTMDIEKLAKEKEGFKDIIDKLQAYTQGSGDKKQNIKVLIESLTKTATKAAEDQDKLIQFTAVDIDAEAIEKGPRREIKEILMQLIRNSAVHGIEMPDARKAKGKKETGTVKLSIKIADDKKSINIKLSDDGNGLNYPKIAQRALEKKLIKPEDAENRDVLLKIIFSPGFSTAETEGVHAGRGIGLNLVRDRVKEIKGSLKIRSEDGKGTLFLINVPLNK